MKFHANFSFYCVWSLLLFTYILQYATFEFGMISHWYKTLDWICIQFQINYFTISSLCAIMLNYCTYTNHVGVSPRALYCVVDTSYGLGRSLGDCRPALPKGRKYQMVKTQTESHVRRSVVWTNWWQIWVFFSFEFLRGMAEICHTSLCGFSEAF